MAKVNDNTKGEITKNAKTPVDGVYPIDKAIDVPANGANFTDNPNVVYPVKSPLEYGTIPNSVKVTNSNIGGVMPAMPDYFNKAAGIETPANNKVEEDATTHDNDLDNKSLAQMLGGYDVEGKGEGKELVSNEDVILQQFGLASEDLASKSSAIKETNVPWHKYYEDLPNIYEGTDLYDLRALNQSNTAAVGNITARFLGTSLQAFTEPFVHLVALPFVALPDVKMKDVYDNPITRGMDDLNDSLKEAFPVFSTKAQDEAGAFDAINLSSAAFFDKVTTGVGFTVGTLLNAYATAGIGGAIRGSSFAKSLGGIATKLESAVGNPQVIARILSDPLSLKLLNSGASISQVTNGIVSRASRLTGLTSSMIAASAEGGVEAREVGRELRPVLEGMVKRGEITKVEADDRLETAMNTVYAANTMIVGLSTHFQFAGIMFKNSGRLSKAGLTFRRGSNEVSSKILPTTWGTSAVKRLGLSKPNRFTKFLDFAQYSHPIVTSPLAEAKEEGLQFITGKAVKAYYSEREGNNYLTKIMDASDELFDSKEGQESMLIGALVGLPGGVAKTRSTRKEIKQNDVAAGHLNSYLYGEDSKIKAAFTNIGTGLINNKNNTRLETLVKDGKVQDDALLDLFQDEQFNEFASFVHDSGSLDVINEYITDSFGQEDDVIAKDFSNLAGTSKKERSEIANTVKSRLSDLVNLKSDLVRKTKGLSRGVQDALFSLAAFAHKTEGMYNDYSTLLKEQHGVDVKAEYVKAYDQYKKEKEADYNNQTEEAYNTYKSGLSDEATPKSMKSFKSDYDVKNKTKHGEAYDSNLEHRYNISDLLGKDFADKDAIPLRRVNDYVNLLANYNIEKSILDNNPTADTEIYKRFEDLQSSQVAVEDMIRYVVADENTATVNAEYQKAIVAQAAKDVSDVYGKAVKTFNKAAKKTKPEDVADVAEQGEALMTQIKGDLNDLLKTMTDDSVSEQDRNTATVKFNSLDKVREDLKGKLENLKVKDTVVEESKDISVVEEEQVQEVDETGTETKPSDNEVLVSESIDSVSSSLTIANHTLSSVNANETLIKNSDISKAISELSESAELAELYISDRLNEINANFYDGKGSEYIEAVKEGLGSIRNELDAGVNEVNAAVASRNNTIREADPTADQDLTDNQQARESLGLSDDNDSNLSILANSLNQAFEDESIDDDTQFTLARPEGTKTGDTSAVASKTQIMIALFGINNINEGEVAKYIKRNYPNENFASIWNNSESMAKVLDKIWVETTGKGLNEKVYHFLIYQYQSLRDNLQPSESRLLDYRNFLSLKIDDKYIFISSKSNMKASTFNESYNSKENNHTINYGDFLTINRSLIEGNEVLLNALNEEVVNVGAKASLKLASVDMVVDGKAVSSQQLLDRIGKGDIGDISINEVLELPLDIVDSNGNKIGRYKTGSDISKSDKLKRLANNTIEVEGVRIAADQYEYQEMVDTRLAIVYSMANAKSDTLDTNISHRGTGFLKSNDVAKEITYVNSDGNKVTKPNPVYADVNRVSTNIKVKGSKILIAKNDKVSFKLYESDDVEFDTDSIHNLDSMGNLQNGIPYIAIPAITDNTTGKSKYMIMPLRSAKLSSLNQGDAKFYTSGIITDTRKVGDKTVHLVDKSEAIGERIKQSVISAIDIHVKLIQAKDKGLEDPTGALSDTEKKIMDTLTDKGYNIISVNGLDDYLTEFVHTYRRSPIDVNDDGESADSIDKILHGRIRDPETSIIRVSNNAIEIGKVEKYGDENVATVISIFNDKGSIKFSRYSFTANRSTDNYTRKYDNLTNHNYQSELTAGIYGMLDNAYLRVNGAKLNTGEKYSIPLVNLTTVQDKVNPIENGKHSTIVYDTAIDVADPIDSKGLDVPSYDTFMRNTLRTDVATYAIKEDADSKTEHIYSPMAAIAVNTNDVRAEVEGIKTEDGKTFEEFKAIVNAAPIVPLSDISIVERVAIQPKVVKETNTSEKEDNENSDVVNDVLKIVQIAVNEDGDIDSAESAVYIDMLIRNGVDKATAQRMIDGIQPTDETSFALPETVDEPVNTVNPVDVYNASQASDANGKPIRFRTAGAAMAQVDKLNKQLEGTNYKATYYSDSTAIIGESHKVLVTHIGNTLSLFSEEYVKLFREVSEGSDFIPFVTPSALISVRNNLSNKIVSVLFNSKNDNQKLSDVIDNQISQWENKVKSLEKGMNRAKSMAELAGKDSSLDSMIAHFENNLNAVRSLITHKDSILDMVIKTLVRDNMVTGNFAKGTLVVRNSSTSSFTGESNDDSFTASTTETVDEEVENDSVDNIEDVDVVKEGEDFDELDESKENNSNWDDSILGADYSKKTSVIVKKFLRGVKHSVKDANGNVVVIRDAFGTEEVVNYKDAYEKVLKILINKSHSIESVMSVLEQAGKEDPFFAEIHSRLDVEINDTKSSLVYDFVELVNKTKLNLKYTWISNKTDKQGGRGNKIGDSNKSENKNVIMDQWQAQFMASGRFIKTSDTGRLTVNNLELKAHNKAFDIAHGSVNTLQNKLNAFDARIVNAKAISVMNGYIETYNKNVGNIEVNEGYRSFSPIEKMKTAADAEMVRGKLASSTKSYIAHYAIPVGFTFTDATIDNLVSSKGTEGNASKAIQYFINSKTNAFNTALVSLSDMGQDMDLNISNIHPEIKTAIKPLLNIESKFNAGISPSVYRDSANKAIHAFTNYKYIDEVLSDLHSVDIENESDTDNVYYDIVNTAFGKDSYLLADLMKRMAGINKERGTRLDNSDNLVFDVEDGLVVQGNNNKNTSIKIDQAEKGDIEVNKLLKFLNRDKKEGYFYYPTLSDGKSIVSIPMTKFDVRFKGEKSKVKVNDSTLTEAFSYTVQPEIDRILAAAKIFEGGETVDIENFEEGSKHFILHPYLNKFLPDTFGENGINTSEEFRVKLENNAREAFAKFVDSRVKAKISRWESMGIVYKNSMRIMDNKSVDGKHYSNNPYEVAADFELNYLIFTTGVNQVFMGDTAAYWNHTVSATNTNMSKRLAGHRGPGQIGVAANGNETFRVTTINDVKLQSEAITFLDSISEGANSGKIDISDGQELTSLYEDMHLRVSHNGTSRALMDALYHDNNAVVYKAFQRMFEGSNTDEDINYDDFIKDELKKVDQDLYDEYVKLINQPVKPMYFNNNVKEFNGVNIRSAVYIKSSSFPLRPSLTKGLAIDKLRKAMDYSTYQYLKERRRIEALGEFDAMDEYDKIPRKEGGGSNSQSVNEIGAKAALIDEARKLMIDRYSFRSATKLGNHTAGKSINEEDIFGFEKGASKDIYDKLQTSSNSYKRRGFKIQMELPFNINKEKIKSGTQERKLLFNGMFNVEGMEGLKQEFDAIYTELYKDNYDSVMEELMVDGELNYVALNEMLVSEGLGRGYDNDDIAELALNDEGNGFENSLSFHRRDKSIEPLVMSIVKNRVLAIKLPGRSFALGTEAGFYKFHKDTRVEVDNADRDGIVYTSKFEGTLKSHGFRASEDITVDGVNYAKGEYLTLAHVNHAEAEGKYFYQPDQIILPSYYKDSKGKLIDLKEKDANGKNKFIVEGENGRMVLDETKFDLDTLESFGFRIPTQGHSSMASMEIVGFADLNVGELVIAPKDFVYRMGSDFDIDKLYMYRPAIDRADGKFVKSIDPKAAKMNRLLDIHHEVIRNTNPSVQKAMASPLSYGFFKEEGDVMEDGNYHAERSNYKPAGDVKALFETMRKGREDYVIGEFIEELYGGDTEQESPLSSDYQADFYEKGKMGKDGIAIFSSRSVLNSVLQQPAYYGSPIEMGKTVKGKFKNDAYNITLGGHTFEGRNFGNNETVDDSGYTVADVISWYQSTAVDNAKLNKLHKLNINSATVSVVNFLNQAGFHEHVLWFINQPIIRDYAEMISSSQSMIGKPGDQGDPKKMVKEKYNIKALGGDKVKFLSNDTYTSHRTSMKSMADNISNYKDTIGKSAKDFTDADKKFFGSQLAILEEFLKIEDNQANLFKGMASVLNVDSVGLGASLSEASQVKAKFLKLIQDDISVFKNIDKVIGDVVEEGRLNEYAKDNDTSKMVEIGGYFINPKGVTGSAIAYGVASLETLFENDFIQFSPNFDKAISNIEAYQNKKLSSSETIALSNALLDSYKRYAHSNALAGLDIDIEAEYNRLLIDEIVNERDDKNDVINTYVAKRSLASVILDIQKGAFKNNPLFASMVATKGNNGRVANVKFNNAAGVNDNDGKVMNTIQELIENDPVLIEYEQSVNGKYTGRMLVRDLFIYSELTGGVQRFGELVKFIPHHLKKLVGFTENLNNTLTEKTIDSEPYLVQFLQHNPKFSAEVVIKGSKGITRLSSMTTTEAEENGERFMVRQPVKFKGTGKISHILVDPNAYGKVEGKKLNTIFNRDSELTAPPVIKNSYFNKKTGATSNSIYKLVYTEHQDEAYKAEGLNGKFYTPLMVDGQLVYERVEELGNSTKTEYDAGLDIDSAKLSALNSNVRVKYHNTIDLEGATYLSSPDVLTNVFGDYSKGYLYKSLLHISNNKASNSITRTMAKVALDNGILEHITVLKRSDLLGTHDDKLTDFTRELKEKHSKHNNPMGFNMDHAGKTGYVVVNDKYFEGKEDIYEAQNALVHELLHYITSRDAIVDNANVSKMSSRFRTSGDKLVTTAKDHFRNEDNRPDFWDDGVDIDFITNTLNSIVRGKGDTVSKTIDKRTGLTVGEFTKKYGDYYGLINFNEFYSEIGSNDNFVEMMAGINATMDIYQSKVITKATDLTSKKSILGAFVATFKKFMDDILTHIFGKNNVGNVVLKDNSIAKFAIYELMISAKRYSKLEFNKKALGFEHPMYKELNAKHAKMIIDEDAKPETGGVEGKVSQDLSSAEFLNVNLNDELDLAADTNDAVAESEDVDVFEDLNTLSRTLTSNTDAVVNSYQDETYTENDEVSEIINTDDLVKNLSKEGRIQYSCKL